MCGILGYQCNDNKYDERLNIAIPILALHMEIRGRKSWGWTDGRQEIVKATGEISKSFNPSFFGYPQAAAHTRQPTTGAVTKDNSHPFQINNLIGMHNGVVYNHDELQKKYERQCVVDSEHIFYHISEGKSLSDIRAYGAIVYYKDGVVHFGRFNGGQLTLVKTTVGWLFASTKESLEIALQFSGLRDGAIFFKLKEDRLYKIVNGELVKDMKLDFGSYNKQQYGTWENGGGRAASTFQDDYKWNNRGYYGYGQYGYGATTYGTASSGNGTSTPTIIGSGTDSDGAYTIEKINDRRYKVRYNQKGGRILTALEDTVATKDDSGKKGKKGKRKVVGSASVNDRIGEMIMAAAATRREKPERKASTDEFPCGYCKDVIKEFELFGMLENGEILCQYCAMAYAPDDCIGGVLANTLPIDVMLVEAFFSDHEDPEDKVVSCDECDDKLASDEFFACAPDNNFYCLQCFMEKYRVQDIEGEGSTDFPKTYDETAAAENLNQQLTEAVEANLGPANGNVIPFKKEHIM